MFIVILFLSKTKEFVKEILYELLAPKGTYSMVEGTKYCRNCSHNSIQFTSRIMIFVKTCRNLRRKLWQDSTLYYLHTVSKSKWHKTFTHWSNTFLLMLIKRVWMRLISLIADSLVCLDTVNNSAIEWPSMQSFLWIPDIQFPPFENKSTLHNTNNAGRSSPDSPSYSHAARRRWLLICSALVTDEILQHHVRCYRVPSAFMQMLLFFFICDVSFFIYDSNRIL